jgi:hypothetical protein
MKVFLKIIASILIFGFLTVLTQVGGLIYLLSLLTHRLTDKWAKNNYILSLYRFISFLILYLFCTFLIIPFIAKPFGREPLPLLEKNHLQPLNVFTFLLNRNYVKSELKEIVFSVANKMNEKYPGTTVNYLDANFPFVNGFPLIPHLSHNDGKKLDLSFCYKDSKTGISTNNCPSFIGYGVCEEALPGEINTSDICSKKGQWQYTIMSKIVSQKNKADFLFDPEKTKALVVLFSLMPPIEKIFIEPHLKNRLKITSGKVRFHGCHAVRHDDHLHVQIK